MAERRPERVGHLVQAELARLLLRDAKDPRLQRVTVTAVRENDATALHESAVYAKYTDPSGAAPAQPDGSYPDRDEIVGPYVGIVLTTGALPENIGALHCLADLTGR